MTRGERPSLLDVNVLVALAWPNHLHHQAARRWFSRERTAEWATCPLTESGFVRVSVNPRIGADPRTVAEAITWLRALRALPGHRFVADDVSFAVSPEVVRERVFGHRQVTDAHLLALARRHQLQLVTFDSRIQTLVRDEEDASRLLFVLG